MFKTIFKITESIIILIYKLKYELKRTNLNKNKSKYLLI